MKKLFTKEFVIGISVIMAIIILYVGIDYLKGVNLFKPANFYVAAYDNVAGLEVAAPVTVDGFKVGQVREINFDYENHGKIKVILALNKSLRLPVDSKAVIGSTLMSGAYVDIKMGKSKDLIEVGGDIATQTNPDMMASLSDNVLPAVGEILPKVDSLLANLNKLVGDPALLKSVQSLEGITDNINKASLSLNTVIGRQVPGMMNNVNHVATNLDSITRDLIVLSAELKRLPISSTMDNVNEMTGNLAKFSNQLNSRESTLGLLMNDPELYNRINRLSADVDSLIVDLQKNPKRYISIKLL
ncbi:MAG: MlaD family protein [Muribaculaceae bacterium]|jgi:phospholipid/cholesterol/gamma-HCH transport system substrate-binding protein